ncbi:hypothetical protein PMAYCL1PPCAC_21060 [Pristionchus mayeri]|uniref:NR LBD domain-containing protein n=1 Tax=Pristionchus mayeri TaxID=1317129 RepID=A0AAN5I4A8_9BILA|nr:hypothetical protein PMAYCL1PPCAC_21060 [Pristionchus mayeri]
MCCKQLRLALSWSRRVLTACGSEVPQLEQVLLLHAAWPTLFVVQISQSGGLPALQLLLAPELTKEHGSKGKDEEESEDIKTRFDRLTEFRIDLAEAAACKGLALFNPETPGLAKCTLVERMRERVSTGLEEYCRDRRGEDQTADRALALQAIVSSLTAVLKSDDVATAILGEACKLNDVFMEVFSASLLPHSTSTIFTMPVPSGGNVLTFPSFRTPSIFPPFGFLPQIPVNPSSIIN